jgi:hypothetical protein
MKLEPPNHSNMKTRLFSIPVAALGLALAAFSVPSTLPAEEMPHATAVRQEIAANDVRYDIEITNGKLLLDNLRDKIDLRAKWGASSSVDATLLNVVEVLRDLHTNANITIAPGLEKLRVGDLKLRSSRLDNELQAIQLASGLKFDCVLARNSDATNPFFLLSAQPAEQTRKADVFNLSPYFQQLGEPDSKEIDENVQRISDLILKTYAELRPDTTERPSFQFHPGANLLVVIGQPDALEVAQKCINALQQPFAVPGMNTAVPGLLSFARNRAVSPERREILKKLQTIRLDSVLYDGLPLSEIVRNLVEESKKRDPEKKGVNFLMNPTEPNTPAPVPRQAIDPTSGLPVTAPAPSEQVDINSVTVRINPALVNVRLVDVLDAIVKVADHPIRYSVTDYAVMFSLGSGADDDRPMLPGASVR